VGLALHPWLAEAAVNFQRVLKGLPAESPAGHGLTDDRAQAVVDGLGILSNWWLNAPDGQISPRDVGDKLTHEALVSHLSDYDRVGAHTAFISTTAGTVEVHPELGTYCPYPPDFTALSFATREFTEPGYLAHAYLFVLGRQAVELAEFAEEVRDVHQYSEQYPWHHEGEIVAKVHIPAQRIEKIERYSCDGLEEALRRRRIPIPAETFTAPSVYCEPTRYLNLRGFPELTSEHGGP
jgi:hypothetical protein